MTPSRALADCTPELTFSQSCARMLLRIWAGCRLAVHSVLQRAALSPFSYVASGEWREQAGGRRPRCQLKRPRVMMQSRHSMTK